MPKLILNFCDLYNHVWFVMKTKQGNDMIDRTDVVHVKKKTKLS